MSEPTPAAKTPPPAPEGGAKPNVGLEPDGWRQTVREWLPAVIVVVILRMFIAEPFRIPSGSMVPTLLIGDHVLVSRLSYGLWIPFKSFGVPFTGIGLDDVLPSIKNIEVLDWADPDRGDVIVFHFPKDEDITYIKRVVAIAGDVIRVQDNRLVINGVPAETLTAGPYDDVNGACMRQLATLHAETVPRQDGTNLQHGILTNDGLMGRLRTMGEVRVPAGKVFAMGDNRDNSEDGRAWGFVDENQIKGKAWWIWLSWDPCSGGVGGPRLERMPRSIYAMDGVEPKAPMSQPATPTAVPSLPTGAATTP